MGMNVEDTIRNERGSWRKKLKFMKWRNYDTQTIHVYVQCHIFSIKCNRMGGEGGNALKIDKKILKYRVTIEKCNKNSCFNSLKPLKKIA